MALRTQTPWAYRKASTALHNLPAGLKLAFLLVLSLAVFLSGEGIIGLIILSCIGLVLIVLSLAAHIAPWRLLAGSGPLIFIVLAVFTIQGVEISPLAFNIGRLGESAFFCVRIGLAFAAGSLLFAVTTPGEMRKALCRAQDALRLNKLRLGLSISLMLGFLPRFFEIWEDANLAWQSRGGRKNPLRFWILVPLVIERMMVKAADTASALESRGAQ